MHRDGSGLGRRCVAEHLGTQATLPPLIALDDNRRSPTSFMICRQLPRGKVVPPSRKAMITVSTRSPPAAMADPIAIANAVVAAFLRFEAGNNMRWSQK